MDVRGSFLFSQFVFNDKADCFCFFVPGVFFVLLVNKSPYTLVILYMYEEGDLLHIYKFCCFWCLICIASTSIYPLHTYALLFHHADHEQRK